MEESLEASGLFQAIFCYMSKKQQSSEPLACDGGESIISVSSASVIIHEVTKCSMLTKWVLAVHISIACFTHFNTAQHIFSKTASLHVKITNVAYVEMLLS